MPNPLGVSSLSAQGPALWRSTEPTNPTDKGQMMSIDPDDLTKRVMTGIQFSEWQKLPNRAAFWATILLGVAMCIFLAIAWVWALTDTSTRILAAMGYTGGAVMLAGVALGIGSVDK